jgi:hypothetical protein
MSTRHYGLSPKRYVAIDDELRRAAKYFEKLAAEIDATAASTDKQSHAWLLADGTRRQIEALRYELAQRQRRQG